jgi:hypothetical protein
MFTLSVSAACTDPTSRGEHSPRSESAVSPDYPWSADVREAAERFAVAERLLRAVMQVESDGDVHAVSGKGAMGLMQIMPATWEELRIKYRLGVDPYQPRGNILAGAAYLREMLDRFGRDGFLAAYNAGPGRYEDHLATGRPLPRETTGYVRKLAPLIDGSVPIPTRPRQGEDRPSALDSVIFARVANTRIAWLRKASAGPMLPPRLCSPRSANPACEHRRGERSPILRRSHRNLTAPALKV